MLQELRSTSQGTKIMFERMDLLNLNLGQLNSMLLKINMKMQNIDLFINGMEILMDRDLQRSMNMNMVRSSEFSFSCSNTNIEPLEPLLEHDVDDARHDGQK